MAREWVIEVEKRQGKGTGNSRRLRAVGSVPAVVYGGGLETIPVTVSEKEVGAVMRSGRAENTLLTLKLRDTGETFPALIREVQVEPVREKILHADFYRVSLTEEVQVLVPVKFDGVPAGVRLQGGLLDVIRHELKVACLPLDLPDFLRVDVSSLTIGEAVRVKDIPAPERVRLLADPEMGIAHVMAPALAEVEAAVPAAEGEVPAEPEVTGKGKVATEEEGEEGEGAPVKEGKEAKGKEKEEKKDKKDKKDKKEKKGKKEDKGRKG